jgi:hypothetical protein
MAVGYAHRMTEHIEDPDEYIDPDHIIETPESLRDSDPDDSPLIREIGLEEDDHYLGADHWGVSAEEQRRGEPLDLRLSEEEPDVARAAGPPDPLAGRLVQPDEGVHLDLEKDEVARSVGVDGGDFGAEEAAVHLKEER